MADDFCAALVASGHRLVMWETDLIHAALSGSPADVAERWDTPVGILFRRHFVHELADTQAARLTT